MFWGHPETMRLRNEPKVSLITFNMRDYEEKSVNMIFYDKNRREA